MAQADDDFDWTTAVPVEDETSSTLAATPFGARTQPQPTQGPVVYDDEFDWKTAVLNEEFDTSTARPLTPQEEHAYYKGLDEASRDPARILTNLEHSSLYDWRQEQDDAVSRFFEGASDIPGNLAQIAVDATKETAQNYAENYALNRGRFYKRNIATGMEAGRKIGVQLLQLFDWGQNKAADIVERGRANDVKMREIAAQVPKTGDERVDGDNVMAAIAKARDEGVFDETPFGPNKEEDYERYLRQNSYNRTHAGTITEATMGGKTMTFPEEQLSFMGEKPMQSVATGGAMIFDPVNALPVGAGIFSKLRILRRLSRVTGMPLPAVERGLAGAADRMEDLGTRAAAKVTEKTGLSKNQQLATLGTTSAGAGLLAANTDGMDGVLLPVAALASVPVLYKLVGGTIRKTSQAAGVGAEVVREMRAGNIGSMRQASAEDLLRTGAVPKPYANFMQPYATGVESTLGRMAKNPNNAEITRKLSRLADNTGVTQAFRFTDDAVSSGVAATLASTPFALLAPDEEQAGAIVGGAAFLGTVAGPATGAFTRRQGAVNADIARMLIDVHAVNGDVPALLSLGRDRLGQIAGMQGIVAGKTDFVTLRASDYRANVDLRKSGNETKAGVFIEKASDGTARIFINVGEPVSMDGKVRVRDRGDGVREIRVRGADGRTEFIAAPKNRRLLVNDGDTVKAGQQVVDYLPATRSIPHEIAHAILTSDILDGDIRTDMQNYVTQVYGEDGIQARGREYIGKIVDGDIMFGTHEGQVILTPEEAADVRSGKRTMSDVMKGKPVEAAERDALIAARIDEYNQRSRENGGNDWDWARNEVIAEQFAGESQGIDFRSIRRGGPKLMESALATSARVLEALGAKFDRSTGKPLDNPSVLFRDNPLFQSPVLRKRMIEHVRAYNDLLTGLEEAGKREARGTKVSVDGTPESAARSPHMKQRADNDNPEKRGQVGNEFLYIDETGKTQWRSPSEVRSRENARTSQAKTLYNPSRIVSPTSTEFGLRRTDSGRTVIGGPTLPQQFDSFIRFPKWFREFARTLEASRERGGTFIADYNAIGDGKDGTYRVRNRGDIRAILREVGFIGWEMTRNNHLKAVLIDLNAFRAATMKAINNGELGIFNNDMSVIEADLRAYLDNHKNGRPGETGIGQAKRDMLNGLIGTGTAVQRKANPLYSDLNPRGSVRSFRLDRFNDLTPTGREGLPFDYDKINQNRMPSALPQTGMAMPDGPVRGERADIPLNPRARQAAFISDRGEVRATGRATHFETNEDLGPDFLAIGAGHLGEDGFFRFGSQSMDEAMGDSPATSSAAAARYNQSVYDQGRRPSSMLEEPPGLERPTAAESPAADAVGLKSAKFLESAVGDGMENLRQRQARRPGTGVAKNDLVRFHTNDGKPIYIGAVKKDGGKSFKGWVEETEAWLPPEQTQQFRQWYKELYGHFTKIFGDRAGEMMMAWLAAQQNVSPGGALKNVFRVEDRIAGIGTGKKGGLADAKIEGVLRDVVPEGGFGPKLSDFVDSGFQRETRTYMAGRPEGGRPFVADVHTGRDSGHVDQQTLSRLKELSDEGNLFIDGAPATVKVTKTKTVKRGEKTAVVPERIRVTPASGKSFFVDVDMRGSPGSTQYEGISVWGNSMTDYLNSTQWAGGNWTPAEVQAVGWMRTLRQYGLPESTVESALQQNTARIFAEVNYSSGDLLPANFPGFETLRPDAQNAITIDVITQSVNELADIIGGSLRVQRISAGQGVWGKSRAPTTVIEVLGSPEATDLLGLGLATASEQAATMSATLGVGGKNSKVMTFRKADGSKFTDVEMQSLIDDAGLSGYTLQQLPGGDVGFVADSTADFRPKGFTEKRAAQFEQNIVDWAERSGVDLRVDTTPAQIKSYGNNWQNQKGGESYVSGLIERGGSSRVRDILRFRGRFAEILQDAIKRHAPEALAPDPAQQIAPIRQAAESPPAAVLEMLRAS
jgi:hypothetical protein